MPYITLWGPSRPLLAGVLVSVVCGIALLVEAALVLKNGGRRLDGASVRFLAVVAGLVGIGALVLAERVWSAYAQITCATPSPTVFHPAYCLDPDRAAAAVSQFQPFEWSLVVATCLLLLGAVVMLRTVRRQMERRA